MMAKLAALQVGTSLLTFSTVISNFPLVPKENQEPEAILTQKPPAKRRGRKRKEEEPTNENDQQNVSPTTKTTPKTNVKRKAIAPAPKTTVKRK